MVALMYSSGESEAISRRRLSQLDGVECRWNYGVVRKLRNAAFRQPAPGSHDRGAQFDDIGPGGIIEGVGIPVGQFFSGVEPLLASQEQFYANRLAGGIRFETFMALIFPVSVGGEGVALPVPVHPC